ncbi:transmembrane 6 superfamily member 1-like [Panonychus citri]|uniref:transmembrane 6 superfamily member 1-like n=1 Tax=Panonychus citri TaxID=50023 RepID=UPI0023077C25|nr:transmembrane 6 superfamily member 1-like [Panonychus citri]XP_053209213.1 transmembrane 6 superfamily member 1-like [Panonychus citri]
MSFSVATKVFITSTYSIPLIYVINRLIDKSGITPFFISLLTILIGGLVLITIIKSTRNGVPRNNRYPFYIFGTICFISVSCLIIALELESLISGFTNSFLKHGEPHLRSSFGAMICHWNGIVNHALALMIVAAITWSNDYTDTLCFWLGSWLNNSLVLLIGIMVGKTGLNGGFLMYLPFIFVPCHMAYCVLIKKQRKTTKSTINQQNQSDEIDFIWKRPFDLILCFIFLLSTLMTLLRGLAVLDSPFWLCTSYTKSVEPYLLSSTPAPFAKIQMIIYLFYYLPFYLYAINRLIVNRCTNNQTMSKLSAFLAGAVIAAQFTHIGSSFHSRTPYILRVPSDFMSQLLFWSINLILTIGPILLAIRCKQDESTETYEDDEDKVTSFDQKKSTD